MNEEKNVSEEKNVRGKNMNEEKDGIDILNDPKNYISNPDFADEPTDIAADTTSDTANDSTAPDDSKKEACEKTSNMSRRSFLKIGGIAAAATTVVGAGAAGFAIGRSDDAYTGYGRTHQGGDMFFNREPFRADVPNMMTPVGEVTRPNWDEQLHLRRNALIAIMKRGEWTPDLGLEKLPGDVGDYYRARPGELDVMLRSLELNLERIAAWKNGAHRQYAIADAYDNAYIYANYEIDHSGALPEFTDSTFPKCPSYEYKKEGKAIPPEDWDFRGIWRDKPMEFKSPKHASKLIKRMAHMYGASVVGITKFDPRFMFKNHMRGMPDDGHGTWGDKVPEHWKSIIVFGAPMSWDSVYSAIGYSSTYGAYHRTRVTSGLLERFIRELGYPARAQFPNINYEIMMTPYVLLAGLGEYGRAGYSMIPELGANFRPAAVITNIEFEYDKPIDIKMADFCKKCKICAENCPSGAISMEDEPTTIVRGFKRWKLDEEKCFQQWCGGARYACGICLGVCPYTRKNTWIHTISRELEPRDPTGLVASGLLAMQQNFFKYHEAEDYRPDWNGGKDATYHNPVWWLRSENFFELEKDWKYRGME